MRIHTLLMLLLSLIYSCNTFSAQPDKEFRFGVFPYLAPRIVERLYAPIGVEFATKLKTKVRFFTSSNYQNFMSNLDKQMYDIVFVQPFDYVAIADKFGYKPLAVRNEKLPAILVVSVDSPIKKLSDLKGKTIGLPPKVAAISYLIKNHLKQNNLRIGKEINVKHFRSHFSCMHNILIGVIDACGTAPPAVRVFKSKMQRDLRIISKTDGIPNSLFAVHPRVPPEKVSALKKLIISWQNSEKGRQLLKNVKVKAFVDIKDSEYNGVREMAKKFRK